MPAILVTASAMAAAWILFTYFAPFLEDGMGYARNGVTTMLVVYGVGAVARQHRSAAGSPTGSGRRAP